MADLPASARVVIVGGGAVGVSALYHLALKGWTDCVLVEKNELTSGSTWHAAGNVPTFSASWSVMNIQRYSTNLYRDLGDRVDYPIDYHVTGSLRLAHSQNRMMEFERVVSMGRYQGMESELVSLQDLKDRYPFLETRGLEGGLYDPGDGDIDPAQLTQALAAGARALGAKIIRFCPVTGIRRDVSEWVVETTRGVIRCENVVNAAGYRAQEVGAMLGRFVPMTCLSHQYIVTDTIPELETWTIAQGSKLPLLRDVDSSYYLRQENFGLLLGPYERNCRAHWTTPDDPMPEDFSFQLYSDDLDRLEWYIEDAVARVPILGTVDVNKVINGPIPYTPDGNPLVGPVPGVPGAFEACVFTFGIAQAGGAGKVLAEWVVEGETEWDMWSCDPRRFMTCADQSYADRKGVEVYSNEYAMHFPHHEWPAARGQRLSPLHDRLQALGAQFGVYGGWERPNWYASPGDDTSEAATWTWEREGPWFARVREECEAVRDAAGIISLSGFSRYSVVGPGAARWLEQLVTGNVPRPGRVGLGYFCDERGRIVTEMSMMRLDPDSVFLTTAAAAESHDLDWLRMYLPVDSGIIIENRTEAFDCHLLTGPESRDILSALCDAELNQPWMSWQETRIAGRKCLLVRLSYAGELGWEVHTAVGDSKAVFDAIMEAGRPLGLKPFGMYALDSLRMEKGYRSWKGDLSSDYTLLEAGLDRFVRWDKDTFIGKRAMEVERQAGPARRFVTLLIDDRSCDAPYMSTLRHGGEQVGETTSGGWGHRIGKSIAFGMVRADLAVEGTILDVEVYGRLGRAVVQADRPLYDPDNLRMKH